MSTEKANSGDRCGLDVQEQTYKERTAEELTLLFVRVSKCGLVGVVVLVVALFFVPLVYSLDPVETFMAARLTFLNICLIVACFELILGILLVLLGIVTDYKMDVGAGQARLRLIAASPGILLIVLGNALLALCIFRSASFTQDVTHSTSGNPDVSGTSQQFSGQFAVPKLKVVDGPK